MQYKMFTKPYSQTGNEMPIASNAKNINLSILCKTEASIFYAILTLSSIF